MEQHMTYDIYVADLRHTATREAHDRDRAPRMSHVATYMLLNTNF